MGFLNEQSLRMIVRAQRNIRPTSFFFPWRALSMSMPLNQSGLLKKMIIAVKFNASAMCIGWPELQVIRNGRAYFSTNAMEPKPTGYLNVYEYDLLNRSLTIQAEDAINKCFLAW